MLDWARRMLGVAELEQRMTEVEERVGDIEDYITSEVNSFGSYSSRTDAELSMMINRITELEETVDSLIRHQENLQDVNKAKALLKRIRNNKTRAINAINS